MRRCSCSGLPPPLEGLDDDHVPTAAGAWRMGLDRLSRDVVIGRWCDCQQLAGSCEAVLAC
jgi:hypothetical protein